MKRNLRDISSIANNIVNIFNRETSDILEENNAEIYHISNIETSAENNVENNIVNEYNLNNDGDALDISVDKHESKATPKTSEEIMENLIRMNNDNDKSVNGGVSLDSIVDNLVGGSKQQSSSTVIPIVTKDISPNLFEGGDKPKDKKKDDEQDEIDEQNDTEELIQEINDANNNDDEEIEQQEGANIFEEFLDNIADAFERYEENENNDDNDMIPDIHGGYSEFINDYNNNELTGGNVIEEEQLDLLPVFPYIVSI